MATANPKAYLTAAKHGPTPFPKRQPAAFRREAKGKSHGKQPRPKAKRVFSLFPLFGILRRASAVEEAACMGGCETVVATVRYAGCWRTLFRRVWAKKGSLIPNLRYIRNKGSYISSYTKLPLKFCRLSQKRICRLF
jgi:hypothetical protein